MLPCFYVVAVLLGVSRFLCGEWFNVMIRSPCTPYSWLLCRLVLLVSQEGEMVLPGSLTYRTYGYLMVAYAVEKQWGAAIELALVRIVGPPQ